MAADEREALTARESAVVPTLPLLHATFLLAGLGTMLLGPLLPLLSRRWHLGDAQAGLMPLAQFCGATLGGSTVSSRLGRSLLAGLACAAAGFLLFALAPQFVLGLAGLLIGGFGIGRTISCTNILAGSRPSTSKTTSTGSTLSWLNFSWSFGALLAPLSAAWIATRFGVAIPPATVSILSLTLGIACALQFRSSTGSAHTSAHVPQSPSGLDHRVNRPVLLYFCALLLLYGGFETSLSVWLTTFALRYGRSSLVLSEYTMVLLLCGLTGGRAFAAWLLRHIRDQTLQRLALVLAMLSSAALALAHTATVIATLAVLLGFTLAPVFPATFALVLQHRPSANQAGIILAASGIGAAALPWLMGVVSTRTGSLQIALILPIAAAGLMLVLTLRPPNSLSVIRTGFPIPPGV